MADKRLEEIRTGDMTESTVNVELVEWLKTRGVNILLVVLLAILAIRLGFWWADTRAQRIDELWGELAVLDMPASLLDLAERAEGVASLPHLARLNAARQYYRDILNDKTLEYVPSPDESDPDAEPPSDRMTAEERADLLDRMERIYRRVMEDTAGRDNETNWREPLHIQAMFGLAAVEEMRGEWDRAREWYERIDGTARSTYPALADLALAWRDNQDQYRDPIMIYTRDEINAALFPERATPIITPDETGEMGPMPPYLPWETPPGDSPDTPAPSEPEAGEPELEEPEPGEPEPDDPRG